MSSATGIGVRAPLVAAAAACWTLSVWAQAGAPSQAPDSAAATAAQRQRIEDAHDDVRRVTESTSRDAARLSHELGGVVDADPAARPVTRQTFIDRLVFDRIERDGIPHAGLASDEEFVRRVFLDAIGLPPTPAEARAFLADAAADKRSRLIDSLLAFDRFDRPSASEVRADIDWLFASAPVLQQRAAGEPSHGNDATRDVPADPPRTRRSRWTPDVHFVETTDVDINTADDAVKE